MFQVALNNNRFTIPAAAPLGAAAEQANPVRFACYQRENWAPNFLFGGATAPSLGAVACVSLTL